MSGTATFYLPKRCQPEPSGGIGAHAIAAAGFRPVERPIGAAEKPLRLHIMTALGKPDGDGDRNPRPVFADDESVPFDLDPHPLGDFRGAFDGRVRHYDDEFLAAQSADEIGNADHLAHTLGESLQDPVPGLVTVGIVDAFEIIDVDDHQG